MQDQANPAALAISVGNVHRIEKGYVDIDFAHFQTLKEVLDVPLVIHGTSGINPADIKQLASNGVSKFNVGTTLRKRFGNALRQTLRG